MKMNKENLEKALGLILSIPIIALVIVGVFWYAEFMELT